MGSCMSKKAARADEAAVAGAARGSKVAAPLPAAEKGSSARHALPPVAEADVEEEEVKEVVLSETPVRLPPPPPPPPEPVKRRQEQPEAEEEAMVSEACSAGDTASVDSSAAAKEKAMAKLQKHEVEREAEKRTPVDAPTKKGRAAPEERERKRESKPRGGENGRARSPSPSSAHRRQQPAVGQQQHHHHHPPAPRPRREQPHVVSGIGCRSGRFSPSAARRAAESVVRRTHSAREADMSLPSKCSITAAIHGINAGGYGGGGGGALSRRDPGDRSGRRSDSPTGSRRAPASPSASHHRAASPMRKAAAKDHGSTPERASRPRVRDGGDEHPAALAGLGGGGERKKVAEGEEGAALGQNPSVAMECFIFL